MKHDIPTTQSMFILITGSQPPNPDLNRRTTSRTPIYHYWPTGIYSLLSTHSSPNAPSKYCRKPSPKMKVYIVYKLHWSCKAEKGNRLSPTDSRKKLQLHHQHPKLIFYLKYSLKFVLCNSCILLSPP